MSLHLSVVRGGRLVSACGLDDGGLAHSTVRTTCERCRARPAFATARRMEEAMLAMFAAALGLAGKKGQG